MTPSTERIPFIFKGMFYAKLFMLFNNIGGKLFFSKTSFERKTKQQKNLQNPFKKINEKKINTETKKTTPS